MSLWSNLSKAVDIASNGIVARAEAFAKASDVGSAKIEPTNEEPSALLWDPYSIVEQLGFKDKPSMISYQTIAAMVWKTPIIQSIILTRLHQISAFARIQQDKFSTGYRVSLKDKHANMSPADKKLARKIEDMFSTTGVVKDNQLERCNFDGFLRATCRDSLTYDQKCFELIKNRKGQPTAWFAVDAATIRLADTATTTYTYDPDRIHTVQIYDNMVINQWTKDRMAFCVRNPHTSIRQYGYGVSECEMLIQAITAILWAWEYNQRFFSQGSVAKGILNIKGTMNQKMLKAFRRHWYQMISGVENAWRSPVLNSPEGAEWIDMHPSNRDMEFSAWMDFLIKVISGVWQMDPMELNFEYAKSGGTGGLFESANKKKLTDSKDKGLRPLLHSIENDFTTYIVSQINPDFVFEFVGLERETKEELAKLNEIRVRSSHTLNEIRKEQDLDPIEGGDIVLNPVWVQYITQQQQMQMQQEQALQQGLEGGVGDGEESGADKPGADAEDEDTFGEDDFAKLQDPNVGSAGAAGKPTFGKSMTLEIMA